jgi:hypothetical protein
MPGTHRRVVWASKAKQDLREIWRGADMTKEQINSILEDIRSWPEEDQEELVEVAREILARRTGVYVMNDEEREAVGEGLEQARRGEFVPDDEMESFWKQTGVL